MLETRPNVKKVLMVGGVTLMVCGTILGSILLISRRPIYVQYNTGADGKPVNNISVTAIGKVSVTPDLVTFTATYDAKNSNISNLQADLTKHNNSIVAALKGQGVEDKDIQTASFNIQPNYYYESGTWKQMQDGHTGSVSINVKVRKVSSAGQVVDAAVDAGASQVSSLSFTVDDLTKARSDARKLATKAAFDKANELAQGSNVGLGGLISISESTTQYNPYPIYANASMDSAKSSGESTELSSGSLEVSVDVSATYGIL